MKILAAMIFRDHQMIIPPTMTACSTRQRASSARRKNRNSPGYGGKQYQAYQKKAIIIGAGRTGTALPPMLGRRYIRKVIDLDPGAGIFLPKLKSPSSFAATGRI